MTQQDTITIVGAGIVGICCALSLQKRGFQVQLIDPNEPGQETSFGNAGIISPWSCVPQSLPGVWKNVPGWLLDADGPLSVRPAFWPRMAPWGLRFIAQSSEKTVREISDAMEILCGPSIELYRQHLAGTGHEDLVADSYYIHAFRNAEHANLEGLGYQIRIQKGADLQVIGGAEIRALEPALSKEFQAAVLIKGQARARSPGRIGAVLAARAEAQGARIVRGAVQALSKTDSQEWTLQTSAGELASTRVVIAAGVWSAELLGPLGLKFPVVAERGYHVSFPDPGVELRNSVMDVDKKVVASSMIGGLRLAGISEFGHLDAPPDPRKEDLLLRQAQSILPDLKLERSTFWMGRRSSFPDSLPVIGEIAGSPGLFCAFGHSHYGLMMAPKTGEILADLVSRKKTNLDLKRLSPSRF